MADNKLRDLEELLKSYKPAPSVKELVRSTPILLLVGPTGAGKDSLKDKLMETGQFYHIVSYTTRRPRINVGVLERDGVDYNFTDMESMEKMLTDKRMIEAKVFSGNVYGTSVDEIKKAKDQGKTAMTDVEVQGVREYKVLNPKVMAVFLVPPNFRTWQARLQKRYGDVVDAADHRRRLKTALAELDELLTSDLYIPVVNNNLESLYKEVLAIVSGRAEEGNYEAAREIAHQLSQDIQEHLQHT